MLLTTFQLYFSGLGKKLHVYPRQVQWTATSVSLFYFALLNMTWKLEHSGIEILLAVGLSS